MLKSQTGYTLIEILIVLFIISIVTSVALLNISRNQNNQVDSFVRDLTETITLAEEQAMLQPSVLGLSIGKHTFRFSSYEIVLDDEKKNAWIPVDDSLLGEHKIPKNVEVNIKISEQKDEDDSKKSLPQIIISTNGNITPFTIYVGNRGEKPRYLIKGDADGNVTNKLLS